MTGNIYLVGFMGAGKTTVGRLLAGQLNRPFIDMDFELQKKFGCSIAQFITESGESAFRRAETRLLKKLIQRSGLVVATGGGLIEKADNRHLMKTSGRIVYLKTDFEACRVRVSPPDQPVRPLWRDADSARLLFNRRQELYEEADLTLVTDHHSAAELAFELAIHLCPETWLQQKLDSREAPVVLTMDGPRVLARLIAGRKVALITDRQVAKHHLNRYLAALPHVSILTLAGGEAIKTVKVAGQVWQWLLDKRVNRDDVLVALGGGTVTDLGAFVASTFKRGIPVFLVSTTLLGATDAAIGGKSGLNLGQAKNMVGCFAMPEGVILDAAALTTLKQVHIREGLIEAYKTGLVTDPELAHLITEHAIDLMNKNLVALWPLLHRSAQAKISVVADDYREKGRRVILNLGHTFGHAVEAWHNYRVSHGQAVAKGLEVAVRMSANRGLLPVEVADKIIHVVKMLFPKPTQLPPVDEAWEIMMQDKKIKKGRLTFILLSEIGQPVVVEDVTQDELSQGLLI